MKTYVALGHIWPAAAKALGITAHQQQVTAVVVAITKADVEGLMEDAGQVFAARNLRSKVRINDEADPIRALRAIGLMTEDEVGVYAYPRHPAYGSEVVRFHLDGGVETIAHFIHNPEHNITPDAPSVLAVPGPAPKE